MGRILAAASVLLTGFALQAQPVAPQRGDISSHRVPPGMMYHRVWAVMPLTGSGRGNDPRRPLLAPPPNAARQPGDRSGILGYQMQLSDDGRSALVEMVFATPQAFQAFLRAQAQALGVSVPAEPAARAVGAPAAPGSAAAHGTPSAAQSALEAAVPGLKMFERGKASDQDILTEFKKHKANFTLGSGSVRVE